MTFDFPSSVEGQFSKVLIRCRTFPLPNGPLFVNYIRMSGSESQQGSRELVPKSYLSLLSELHSLWNLSIFLVYDYWLDEYFHLGDLRTPHALYNKKCSNIPSRSGPPPIFFFTQA